MSDSLSSICGPDAVLPSVETHRAVLVLDPVGRITAINRSYLRLTGYQRAELIGRPVWQLLDLAERCAGRLGNLLDLPEGGERHIPELAHVSKNGRRFRVDARVFTISDQAGGAGLRLLFARPEDSGEVISLAGLVRRSYWPAADACPPRPIRAGSLRLVKH